MNPTTQRRILVTSALPYANGPIHLGHMLEYIQTDIWVRFQRLMGNECIYVCADDAHGTPIMLRAEREGITPEQLIANSNAQHQADFRDFGIAYDQYSSTHSETNRGLTRSRPLRRRPDSSWRVTRGGGRSSGVRGIGASRIMSATQLDSLPSVARPGAFQPSATWPWHSTASVPPGPSRASQLDIVAPPVSSASRAASRSSS